MAEFLCRRVYSNIILCEGRLGGVGFDLSRNVPHDVDIFFDSDFFLIKIHQPLLSDIVRYFSSSSLLLCWIVFVCLTRCLVLLLCRNDRSGGSPNSNDSIILMGMAARGNLPSRSLDANGQRLAKSCCILLILFKFGTRNLKFYFGFSPERILFLLLVFTEKIMLLVVFSGIHILSSVVRKIGIADLNN